MNDERKRHPSFKLDLHDLIHVGESQIFEGTIATVEVTPVMIMVEGVTKDGRKFMAAVEGKRT